MTVITSAGTKIAIGTTAAGTTSDTFTVIGEVLNIPEFGPKYQEITHTPIGNRITQKFKGALDYGSLQLQLGRDVTDAGQTAILAANNDDSPYNFRIELNNAATSSTAGGHGTYYFFKARCMSYTINPGSVNDYVKATVGVGISSALTEAAAV